MPTPGRSCWSPRARPWRGPPARPCSPRSAWTTPRYAPPSPAPAATPSPPRNGARRSRRTPPRTSSTPPAPPGGPKASWSPTAAWPGCCGGRRTGSGPRTWRTCWPPPRSPSTSRCSNCSRRCWPAVTSRSCATCWNWPSAAGRAPWSAACRRSSPPCSPAARPPSPPGTWCWPARRCRNTWSGRCADCCPEPGWPTSTDRPRPPSTRPPGTPTTRKPTTGRPALRRSAARCRTCAPTSSTSGCDRSPPGSAVSSIWRARVWPAATSTVPR